MDTSREISSPFVNLLSDNYLLYDRADCSQMLLLLFFEMFRKIIEIGLLLSFCCKLLYPPSERSETGGYTVLLAFLSVRPCALTFRCKYLENGLR